MFYRDQKRGDIGIMNNKVISGTYEEFEKGGDSYIRYNFIWFIFGIKFERRR